MKKLLIAAALVAAIASQAAAFDFGLYLSNLSAWYSLGGDHVVEKLRAELWLSTPLDPSIDLSVSLWYDFSWAMLPNAPYESLDWFGLEPGEVAIRYYGPVAQGGTSWFKATAGRFRWSDSTGFVFNARVDGVAVEYQQGNILMSGMIGYTGLFPIDSMPIFLSADDIAASEAAADDPALSYALSSPRLVAYAKALFVELFLRQDLYVDLGAQFDLHASPVDPIQSQYLSVALRGSLSTGLSHDTFATLGLVESAAGLSLSVLAGTELTLRVPTFLGFSGSLGFLYGSSGTGFFSSFRPIVQSRLGFAFNAAIGNNLTAYLSLGLRPLEWIVIGGKGIVHMRSSTVQIEDSEFDAASAGLYLGTEAQAYLLFAVSSDFMFELQGGVFFPNAGDTFESTAQPRYIAALFATISL